jgi:hypothetical protein
MMPRSIAKVNAKSIDGYFGVGTSCFFIRGTILSDTPVDGEYPSLSFMRPGNVVEIASFDGVWAVATIRTRHGNRPGDNVIARMYLRDDDLKAHGVDCARIANLNGLPFAFDVASLAAEGLFDHRDLEPYIPVEDDPDPPSVEAPLAEPPRASERVWTEAAWIPPVPPPEPPPMVNETVAEERVAREPAAPETAFDIAGIIQMLRSGRSPFGKIGASVAAVAIPVLLYLALTFLKNNKPPDDETL